MRGRYKRRGGEALEEKKQKDREEHARLKQIWRKAAIRETESQRGRECKGRGRRGDRKGLWMERRIKERDTEKGH